MSAIQGLPINAPWNTNDILLITRTNQGILSLNGMADTHVITDQSIKKQCEDTEIGKVAWYSNSDKNHELVSLTPYLHWWNNELYVINQITTKKFAFASGKFGFVPINRFVGPLQTFIYDSEQRILQHYLLP